MIIEILTPTTNNAFVISQIESVQINQSNIYDDDDFLLIVNTKNHSHTICYGKSKKPRDNAYFKLLQAINPNYNPNDVI